VGNSDEVASRAGWLRAAVLGAEDGITSTAALIVGVAAANATASAVLTAGLAGLVAGAASMAAGEYVSVSSQRDLERELRRREEHLSGAHPEVAITELAVALQLRGLEPGLSRRVAQQISAAAPIDAGVQVKYGITETLQARPVQAALASATAFAIGGAMPLLGLTLGGRRYALGAVLVALVALASFGALAAAIGGAPRWRGALRVLVGGALAIAAAALIGRAIGMAV
jgi:VIT1/CCC1 family predicted Fe2+/Mn2+ transporter